MFKANRNSDSISGSVISRKRYFRVGGERRLFQFVVVVVVNQ